MKKLAIMGMTLALFITGCTPKPAGPQNAGGGEQKPIDVTILTASARENDANIVRDLLAKNGFNPIMNIQPDFASVSAIRETGEWDITIGAWNIVSGNADYAMRPLFYTGSPSNSSGIADPTLDAMIDEGASANIDESWDIYAELERYLVEEMAYIAPLYGKTKNQAVNQTVIVPETAPIPKTRSIGRLEQYEYVDPSNNETRPLNLTSTEASYTSLWPPRQNDTYSAYFTENMYVTLITLDDDGNLMTDGTLSYNYAPTDARDEFYFILRDNITYAKVEDNKAVDTGVKVSADDVVFSLMNAKDPNACPDQRIFDLFVDLDEVTVVTDLEELTSKKGADGISILDTLSEDLPAPIASLTDNIQDVNNAGGVYQVVKVKTTAPSPQILFYLSHNAAGIYNRASVEAVMSKVDLASYDPAEDVIYGDPSSIHEGPSYDNHLWVSGPYIPLYQNDYEVMMEKNPGYMPGTEYEPKIKNVRMKFINNYDTAVASFRSGEIDVLSWIPENYHPVLEADPNVAFSLIRQNNNGWVSFNLNEKDGRVVLDEDIRKAILYSMDQNAFISFYDNKATNAYSPISGLHDTGNEKIEADPAKVQEHLNAYWAKQSN